MWLASAGKEVLYSDSLRLAVYRLGNSQVQWMCRVRSKVVAACLTERAVYAVTEAAQLHTLPRRVSEPTYALPLPRGVYTALLLVHRHPPVLAALSNTGEIVYLRPPEERIDRLTVSRHPLLNGCVAGEYLLVSDRAGQVYAVKSQRVVKQWEGCVGGVVRLASHPEDPYVVGAGMDGIIRIWEYPVGQLQAALVGHRWDVLDAAFSEKGDLLVTIGSDGQALVWRWRASQLPDYALPLPEPSSLLRLHRDDEGRLWLLTSTRMHRLDLVSRQWRTVRLQQLTQKEVQQR